MSVMDRFATLLLIAMAITEAYAKANAKATVKKKKLSVGGIAGIIIAGIIIAIILCVVLFLMKRKKAKAAKIGNVEAPSQIYALNNGTPASGKYEPTTTQPQDYQQQTNYQNQHTYGQSPPQQQGYAQGPPQTQQYGQSPPAQHSAAGEYYKP